MGRTAELSPGHMSLFFRSSEKGTFDAGTAMKRVSETLQLCVRMLKELVACSLVLSC